MFILVKKQLVTLDRIEVKVNSIPVQKAGLIYYSKTFKNLVDEYSAEKNFQIEIPKEHQTTFSLFLSFFSSADLKIKVGETESFIYLVNLLELTNIYLDFDGEMKDIFLTLDKYRITKNARDIIIESLELFTTADFFVKKINKTVFYFYKIKKGEYYKIYVEPGVSPIKLRKEDWKAEQRFRDTDLTDFRMKLKFRFNPKEVKLIKKYNGHYYWIDSQDQLRDEQYHLLTVTQIRDFFFDNETLFVVSTNFVLIQILSEYYGYPIYKYIDEENRLHIFNPSQWAKLVGTRFNLINNGRIYQIDNVKDFYIYDNVIYLLGENNIYVLELTGRLYQINEQPINLEKLDKVILIDKNKLLILYSSNVYIKKLEEPVKQISWIHHKIWVLTENNHIKRVKYH